MFILNGLTHYITVKLYGIKILEIIKNYKNEELLNFTIKFVKYELLTGFMILSLISLIILVLSKR